jgi:hypothetical protein
MYTTVGGGPGGAGVQLGGGLAVQRRVKHRLWLRADLRADLAAAWHQTPGGSIRTGHAAAHLMLVWIARERAVVSPRLGLGGGPGLAWALGRATDRSGSDLAAVGAIRGLAGAAIRLSAHLRLSLGLDVEFLLPPVAVQVADVEVARTGTPLISGAVGLEWGWPRRSDRRPTGERRNAEPPATPRATPSP